LDGKGRRINRCRPKRFFKRVTFRKENLFFYTLVKERKGKVWIVGLKNLSLLTQQHLAKDFHLCNFERSKEKEEKKMATLKERMVFFSESKSETSLWIIGSLV